MGLRFLKTKNSAAGTNNKVMATCAVAEVAAEIPFPCQSPL